MIDVLFFHGAGEGAFEADAPLAESLAEHLGSGFRIHMPRLPEEDGPGDELWIAATREAIDHATSPAVVVGHSAGGYLLVKCLATQSFTTRVEAICLIAAPFPGGTPEWTFEGFDLPGDLHRRLPPEATVLLYASEDDETVPFSHRDRYAAALPSAITRTTTGGHQLADGLAGVAADIRHLLHRADR
jgi:predicted alpha/beta hydrolase family esterase